MFDLDSLPALETDRLVLRQLRREADLTALFDLFADPAVARYTDTGPFTELSEAVEVMDWVDDIFARRQGMRWALTLKGGDDSLIGTVGYNWWRSANNSAEVGYDLAQRFWNQGLMTEAVGAVLGFGFDHLALNRIEAEVTVGNEASMRLLAKLGFRREGLLRQRGHWRDAYHDVWLFSLLRSDRPG